MSHFGCVCMWGVTCWKGFIFKTVHNWIAQLNTPPLNKYKICIFLIHFLMYLNYYYSYYVFIIMKQIPSNSGNEERVASSVSIFVLHHTGVWISTSAGCILLCEIMPALKHSFGISYALSLEKNHSSINKSLKRRPNYFRGLVGSPLFLNFWVTFAIFNGST